MDQSNKPKNRSRTFSRLVGYLTPHRASVAVGVLSNIGLGLVALVPPLAYRQITDGVILASKAPVSERQRVLVLSVMIAMGAFLLSAALMWARSYVMHVLGEKIILQLRRDIFGRLQALSLSYFDSRQTGEIMSRVTNDSEVIETFVTHAADTLISDIIKLVAMCAVMFAVSPTLATIAMLPVPVLFLLALRFSRTVRPLYRKIRERLAEINAGIQERLAGVRVVKAFARETYEYERFDEEACAYYDSRVAAVRKWTTFYPQIDLLVKTGILAIWAAGALLVMRGQTSMGTLVMFHSYLGMLYEPVGNLARINDTIQRSLAAAERIFEVIDEEPAIADAPGAVELGRINGRVEFERVSFSYDEGEQVLTGISLVAEPGSIVALVGRSGAGKTSIVNLIPRFYEPTSGRVLIDGADVRNVTQRSLRQQIAMVLQDTFLFNGTVRDNIRYGKLDASDDEVVAAARAANAEEFILEMPAGYETQIGERGIKLSGGQKQRIAIARAFLADPRILVLDEATSSVDSESEYLIHRAMDKLMTGRTTFVIAHRLSTVKHANQIIALEHGRIVEAGDHRSLIDREGVYSQMYAMQFRLDEE